MILVYIKKSQYLEMKWMFLNLNNQLYIKYISVHERGSGCEVDVWWKNAGK